MQWDIFCRVIDNFGDLGVCWRLCADLGARGHAVRLWVDDAEGLRWMAPGALDGQWAGIQVLAWKEAQDPEVLANLPPADVWVEAFGCELPPEFIAWRVQAVASVATPACQPPVWINLEYLSAEAFVERSHGLSSPVMSGAATGWTKHFFYPGFTANTGGLLREPGLMEKQQQNFATAEQRAQWLHLQGIAWQGEQLVSLFCYEPAALPALLAQLASQPKAVHVLVAAGRANAAVQAAIEAAHTARHTATLHNLQITYLPALTQTSFDELLWVSDLNCVRGEDSLVRALWAGKPLVWQIYPQDDGAHIPKLDAFLDVMGANSTWRQFHYRWNGVPSDGSPCALPLNDLDSWSQAVQKARHGLTQRDDLLTQLLHFVLKKR